MPDDRGAQCAPYTSYFPSAIEILMTLAFIAGGILIFDLGSRYLPIYKSELS